MTIPALLILYLATGEVMAHRTSIGLCMDLAENMSQGAKLSIGWADGPEVEVVALICAQDNGEDGDS